MENTKDKMRKRVGKLGEDEACMFLADKGQTILERNWRSGHLEVDIVTMDHRGIHFVEVKTRREPMQGSPQESVNATKQRRLAAAAAVYMARSGVGLECFFDIVTVVFSREGVRMEYFPEAFVPVYYGR